MITFIRTFSQTVINVKKIAIYFTKRAGITMLTPAINCLFIVTCVVKSLKPKR